MFENKIIQCTDDGSHTILIPELNVSYHSKFGALQESKHVFIKEGLDYLLNEKLFNKHEQLNILEVGFGTGLNALLSLNEAINLQQQLFYLTIEAFPVALEEAEQLNYCKIINPTLQSKFFQLHSCCWELENQIDNYFSFVKMKSLLQDFSSNKKFHLIYFDAFDPVVQPELWTEEIFRKLFLLLYDNGVLVTYSSKGLVRRAMQTAGFKVEKIPGPPGKREIVRALKVSQ